MNSTLTAGGRRPRSVLGALLLASMILLPRPAMADEHGGPPELRLSPRPAAGTPSRSTLEFSRLFRFGARAPEPTPELLALVGKRVTLVGFMVVLERPVEGGFYLASYPAVSDESGAGRGGVPPTSVLVLLEGVGKRPIAHVPGALEVSGTLELGNRVTHGETATVRLILSDRRSFRTANVRRRSGS